MEFPGEPATSRYPNWRQQIDRRVSDNVLGFGGKFMVSELRQQPVSIHQRHCIRSHDTFTNAHHTVKAAGKSSQLHLRVLSVLQEETVSETMEIANKCKLYGQQGISRWDCPSQELE